MRWFVWVDVLRGQVAEEIDDQAADELGYIWPFCLRATVCAKGPPEWVKPYP